MTYQNSLGLAARAVAWLKSWLFSAPRRPHERAHPELNPINLDEIATELRLAEEGERLGQHGFPTPSTTVLAAQEQAVIHRLEKKRTEYMEWCAIRLGTLNTQIHSYNQMQRINEALAADQTFETSVNALLTDHQSDLERLAEAHKTGQRELREFKEKHRRIRDAKVSKTLDKVNALLWAIVSMLLDGFINATFFAKGSDEGLIGGYIEAQLFAALNVAVAFANWRLFIPNILHVNSLRKVGGAIMLLVFIVMAFAIAIATAHYRDAMAVDSTGASAEALRTLLASPFSLSEMRSWGLVAICLFFASAAAAAGFKYDEPYPGYAARTNDAKKAAVDYEDALKTLREELDEMRNDAVSKVKYSLGEAQQAVRLIELAIRNKEDARINFEHVMQEAERAVSPLLMKFREANMIAAGPTRPRPAYFDTIPSLKVMSEPDFSVEADKEVAARQEALVAELAGKEHGICSRINSALNRRFELLQPLTAQFPSSSSVRIEPASVSNETLREA